MKKIIFISICFAMVFSACRRDDTNNPYDDIVVVDNSTPDFGDVPESNFAYLHEKVFSPTCANSGCHDGTFEPDFRSISSSFNTLVNHEVISNDENNTYSKRVLPGNSSLSLINARLTEFLPNTSGIMPLEVDEESDWDANSANYIIAIQGWINSGAPDMYGNLPGLGNANLPPGIQGFLAFPENNVTTPYERDPDQVGITPILVQNQVVDIWIYLEDDQTAQQDFTLVEMESAESIEDFGSNTPSPFISSGPLTANDFSNNPVTYVYKTSLDLSSYSSGDIIYLRNYLNDGNSLTNTEIPNGNSNQVITSLFVLEIL